MKFLPSPFLFLAVAWGQTCAPPAGLHPTDSASGTLNDANCRLSDGTPYADYLVAIPSHGSIGIQAGGSFPASAILRDATGRSLGSGASIQQPVEAGNYHVLVNAAVPGQMGTYTLRTTFQRNAGILCRAFPRIGAGRSVTAQLGESSCTLPDGSRYDGFEIVVYGSGTLDIAMNSADFDAYLILRGENGALLASDDNGGGGSNAHISVPVAGNETYTIVASTANAAEKPGQYSLSVGFMPAEGETCHAAKVIADTIQVAGTIAVGGCEFNLPGRRDSLFNFYDLNVPASGSAEIQVRGARFSALLLLLDADGNPIAEDSQSGGTGIPAIRQQLAAGTYRVLVFDENSFGGDYTLQYTFHPGLPEICPVLALDSTRALTGTLSGSSSCRADDLLADVYRIDLPSSGTLDLNLSSGDFSTFLELRDAKDNRLTIGDRTPDGSGSRVLADLPAGAYTIAAASLDTPGGYNIGYRFTPKTIAACAAPPALPVNSGYIGLLGASSCSGPDGRPYDAYRFTTPADGTVAAFMTSTAVDSLLTLTDDAGNLLRRDDNSYVDNNAAIVQYLPAGTYRLEARSAGARMDGLYRVDVLYAQGAGPSFCAPRPIAIGGTAAGNLTFASCLYLDHTFSDFYRFSIADSTQAVDIQANSTDFDAYLILLDAKGNIVASDDNSGGESNARLQQNLDPGTYFAIVKPADDPSSSGKYRLSLTSGPAQVPSF